MPFLFSVEAGMRRSPLLVDQDHVKIHKPRKPTRVASDELLEVRRKARAHEQRIAAKPEARAPPTPAWKTNRKEK